MALMIWRPGSGGWVGGLGVHWFLFEVGGGEQGSGRESQSATPPYIGETGGEKWFGGRCLVERELGKGLTLKEESSRGEIGLLSLTLLL